MDKEGTGNEVLLATMVGNQIVDSSKEPTLLPSKVWPGFIPAATVLALC